MDDDLLRKRRKRPNRWLTALVGVAVVVGASAVSKAMFRQAFPPAPPQTEQEWRALFRDGPLYEALAEFDPAGIKETEDRFVEAGLSGASVEAFGGLGLQSSEVGKRFVSYYGPRAADDRMLAFQGAALRLIRALEDSPEHCYDMFVAGGELGLGLGPDIRAALRLDPAINRLQHATIAMRDVAEDDPVRIEDPLGAQEGLQQIFATIAAEYPQAYESMALGRQPADTEEMAQMCRIVARVSELALASDNAADLFRMILQPPSN